MSKARRKLKPAAGKLAKRPKRSRGKSRMRQIKVGSALRLAAFHVVTRLLRGATVRDGAEVRLGIYTQGGWTAKDVWVVYLNSVESALKPAQVVLVCKRTGRVLYEGSAQDEG